MLPTAQERRDEVTRERDEVTRERDQLAEGLRAGLLALLQARFGDLPDDLRTRLAPLSPARLSALMATAASAPDLASVAQDL